MTRDGGKGEIPKGEERDLASARPPQWHAEPAELAGVLRAGGPGAVRRVHTFQLPPGLLGGIYAASFADGGGAVHRCLLSYANPLLLAAAVRPLREALAALRIPEVEGRIEVGRNTRHALHYFLPSVDQADPPAAARAKREAARLAWLTAARDEARELRALVAPGAGTVLCASAGGHHLLIRLDDGRRTSPEKLARSLGLPQGADVPPESPLGQDILGEWLEP